MPSIQRQEDSLSGHVHAWDARSLLMTLPPSGPLDPTKIPWRPKPEPSSREPSSTAPPVHLCFQAELASFSTWAAAQTGQRQVPVHDEVTD